MGLVTLNNKIILNGNKMTLYNPPVFSLDKGTLITMNLDGTDRQYRVLKDVGNGVYEVLTMWDINTSTAFDSNNTNTYSGNTLDTYLNTTWYGTLSSTAKAAIVAKDINQYQYSYNSSAYNETTHSSHADYSTKSLKANVGNRYVYVLDIEDIEMYFGGTGGSVDNKTPATFSKTDLLQMFWNQTSTISEYLWLRSAYADSPGIAWSVYGFDGYVYLGSTESIDDTIAVRAALQIDLSKISFTQEGQNMNLITLNDKPLIANSKGLIYEPPKIIFFTINGISYQALEGMTWRSWVNSVYNTDSYSIQNNKIVNLTNNTYVKDQIPDRAINAGNIYTIDQLLTMPVKCNLITMNLDGTDRQYRVLKTDGYVAEVLMMWNLNTIKFDSDGSSNTYNGSTLDTYLNTTWYNTLSTDAKNAIVSKNINQYTYTWSNSVYNESTHFSYADYSSKVLKTNVGNRYVYALDIEDIEMYFGGTGGSAANNTPGTFSKSDILQMIYEGCAYGTLWTRSAYDLYSDYAWELSLTISMYHTSVDTKFESRGAFQIDLSKIPFTINS